MIKKCRHTVLTGLIGASVLATAAYSQATYWPNTSFYGTPGLIDMPSAEAFPDAEMIVSSSLFAGMQKSMLSFQITPELTGTFRYSVFKNWGTFSNPSDERYADRSFDLQYRFMEEGSFLPAMAIGVRDFMGTAILGAEYLVATKSVTPNIKVTGGLGWGRLSNSSTVRSSSVSQGGTPNLDQWFRGPVGYFGGVEWISPVENLSFKAEYSSDKYYRETVDRDVFERKTPLNFGMEYSPRPGLQLGLYYLYGSEIGFSFALSLNPKTTPYRNATFEGAPTPIAPRPAKYSSDTSWLNIEGINERGQDQLNQLLNPQGLSVETLSLTGTTAELRFRNSRYNTTSQAIGRAARAMAYVMPDSVETFVLTPVSGGLPLASVTLSRRDLEELEHHPQGSEIIYERARIAGSVPQPDDVRPAAGLYPDFSYSFGPYVSISLFDPKSPIRADFGLRAAAQYNMAPGLSFSGSIRKKLTGNLGDAEPSGSLLPPVRSNVALYSRFGDPALEYATADYLFKAGQDFYGRVSAGYLESMFGGLSTELLWKPAQQDWGIGVDMNYVKQRDFDLRLGFQDYEVLTGHLSAYFQVRKNFQVEINAGRYLAGDWGSTISVDRVFDNGWTVGAYATVTDNSFEKFGEGNFDKGIRMTIPMSWALGKPSRRVYALDLNSLSRDGGARLRIRNRLYPIVSEYQEPALGAGWGRFWR